MPAKFVYNVISDGWIKLEAADFYTGDINMPPGRLLIGLNQLLLRIAGKTVLIDTGLGNKWKKHKLELLGFEKPRMMLSQLDNLGVSPPDIDIVILTHLHYDHAGGSTHWIEGSKLAPVFENAIYYTQKLELDYAMNPDSDRETDYQGDDFLPLWEEERMIVLDGHTKLADGLDVYPAPGHSPGHQVVVFGDSNNTLFFGGDLIPTREHASLVVTSKYDLDPTLILKERKKWLAIIKREGWNCIFCHSIRDHIGMIT